MKKRVVIAINKLNPSAAESLSKLKRQGMNVRVIVLKDVRITTQDRSNINLGDLLVSEVETDYFDALRLEADVAPLKDQLIGVVSRSESSIQYLARLSELCDGWRIPLPTRESLEVATDKQRMRQKFMKHCPGITPKFLRVRDGSQETMKLIDEVVGYPLIIKPANLASSLLIQKCTTPKQASEAIDDALRAIAHLYKESGRHEDPALIVEQMLEGDLYSVDAYITTDGEIFYCPAVEYVTGQSIGVDDFFLYRRSAPTQLGAVEWESCKLAVSQGIQAIGLKATTAHIELCRTDGGWKIIEIGPRVGRYRIEMYQQAYGIEHSDNDVRIRLGLKPEVPTTIKKYCSVYSVYPFQEGRLRLDRKSVV